MSSRSVPRTPIALRSVLRRSPALRRMAVAARHRGLSPGDCFIASYPRSGNTWLRFLLADVATGRSTNFEDVDRVIPSVGFHHDAPLLGSGARLIKTHEQHRPSYRRAIYMVRDVRDVLISWYRVTRDEPDDLSDLDEFLERFGSKTASPYGTWADHVRSWVSAAESSSEIKLCRFEDLRADPVGVVTDLAEFAGIDADQARVEAAIRRNTPGQMHRLERESRRYLERAFGYRSRGVRDGKGADWRTVLDERRMSLIEPSMTFAAKLGYGADQVQAGVTSLTA